MEKSHIIQIQFVKEIRDKDGKINREEHLFLPVFQDITRGNEHDSKNIKRRIKYMKENFRNYLKGLELITLDAGYDSYEIYADIFYYLVLGQNNATFVINPRSDAIVNQYGTELSVNKVVNKMWKSGIKVSDPMVKKLKFLYEHGKKDIVGKYLRNKIIHLKKERKSFHSKYKERKFAEQVHGNIKRTVKFDLFI